MISKIKDAGYLLIKIERANKYNKLRSTNILYVHPVSMKMI